MGINLAGGYGAGAAAASLDDMLKQKFLEQIQTRQSQQADSRIAIDQQRANDERAYRVEAMRAAGEQRAASAQIAQMGAAEKLASVTAPGQVDARFADTMRKGGLGTTIEHRDAQAPSLNLAGPLQAGPQGGLANAPVRIKRSAPGFMGPQPDEPPLRAVEPGQAERDVFKGTAAQQQAQGQNDALEKAAANDPKLAALLPMIQSLPAEHRATVLAAYMKDQQKPANTPIFRTNARTGQAEQIGEAPVGSHFVAEPAPKAPPQPHFSFQTGTDANGKQTLFRVNTLTGESTTVNLGTGVTAGHTKPATDGEKSLALYANRIEQSDPQLAALSGTIVKMNPISFAAQNAAGNPALQSKEIVQYDQASRNFINSVLRRESGAAISASEFTEARKQYLPVPGDDPATLKQKAQNRAVVRENFTRGAGSAYQPLSAAAGGEDKGGGGAKADPMGLR